MMIRLALTVALAALIASCAVLDYADSLRDEPLRRPVQTSHSASGEAVAP